MYNRNIERKIERVRNRESMVHDWESDCVCKWEERECVCVGERERERERMEIKNEGRKKDEIDKKKGEED